jgi:RecJ-like exonuclease
MGITENWERMALILNTVDDDDCEVEIVIHAKTEVCPRCDGKGKHDNPAFSNGITSEEWDRDWDEESREGYRNGLYDVTCEKCQGRRVVLNADENDPNFQRLLLWQKEESDYRALCDAERRMGC